MTERDFEETRKTPGDLAEDCSRVRNLLSPMMDGVLDHEGIDDVGMHLTGCGPCRTAHADLLQLHAELLSVTEQDEEERTRDRRRILTQVFGDSDAEEGSRSAPWWRQLLEWQVTALAVPALAAVVLVVMFRGADEPGAQSIDRPAEVAAASTVPEAMSAAPEVMPDGSSRDLQLALPVTTAVTPEAISAGFVAPPPAVAVVEARQPPPSAPLVVASLSPAGSAGFGSYQSFDAGEQSMVMRLETPGESPILWVVTGGKTD